jgi:hypothetical protein
MNKYNLICKIYFFEAEWKTPKKIIGVVDKVQLFSPLNRFIELKNYGNKTISKIDIERIIVYQKQGEQIITKNTLKVTKPLKLES